jgi:hypothetical protein
LLLAVMVALLSKRSDNSASTFLSVSLLTSVCHNRWVRVGRHSLSFLTAYTTRFIRKVIIVFVHWVVFVIIGNILITASKWNPPWLSINSIKIYVISM